VSPGPLNILLVEDDAVDVMNVQRAFQRAHIRNPLFVASDGEEALELLRRSSIPHGRRLVLLDLNLPRMNGIEFLKELRGDPALRTIPVVVLTTSADDRDKTAAFDLHVAGYLLKPVGLKSFVELMAVVDRYWSRAEMP